MANLATCSRVRVSRCCLAPCSAPAIRLRRHRKRGEFNIFAEKEAPQSQEAEGKKQGDAEEPVWVKREREEKANQEGGDLPFGLYLLFSSFVAIAAVGSVFEWTAKNPIFGVVQPDSILYTPILGLFAITGLPTAGWLFYKAISSANAVADRMDNVDKGM